MQHILRTSLFSFTAALIAATASAQDAADDGVARPDCESGVEVIIIPKGGGEPSYKCQDIGTLLEGSPHSELDVDAFEPQIEAPDPLNGEPLNDDALNDDTLNDSAATQDDTAQDEADIIPEALKPEKPDYSRLSKTAEQQARLTDLFTRLKDEENAEDANLIAEEIWVIWLDSGSPSINLVLRRGSDAQTKNQTKKARRMFDNVTALSPDYAEGWARSSRLALDEKDYSRALTEAVRTLNIEPRHFYALWTLGNAFEQLGRQEEALEAYREANALYPELKAVKERLEQLETEVEGDVL